MEAGFVQRHIPIFGTLFVGFPTSPFHFLFSLRKRHFLQRRAGFFFLQSPHLLLVQGCLKLFLPFVLQLEKCDTLVTALEQKLLYMERPHQNRQNEGCRRRKFPFRKRLLPFETVDAFYNGRLHTSLQRKLKETNLEKILTKIKTKKEKKNIYKRKTGGKKESENFKTRTRVLSPHPKQIPNPNPNSYDQRDTTPSIRNLLSS